MNTKMEPEAASTSLTKGVIVFTVNKCIEIQVNTAVINNDAEDALT